MRLAIRAARAFDGERALQNVLVVVDDDRIAGVESGHCETPRDTHVLDLGDVTLLPGLIDAHVHLGFDASPDPVSQMRADSDATLLLRMRLAATRAAAT